MTKQFANVVLKALNADEIRGMDKETFQIVQSLVSISDYRFPTDVSIAYNSMIDKFYPESVESRNR